MIHLRKFAFSEAKKTAISVTGCFLILTKSPDTRHLAYFCKQIGKKWKNANC